MKNVIVKALVSFLVPANKNKEGEYNDTVRKKVSLLENCLDNTESVEVISEDGTEDIFLTED